MPHPPQQMHKNSRMHANADSAATALPLKPILCVVWVFFVNLSFFKGIMSTQGSQSRTANKAKGPEIQKNHEKRQILEVWNIVSCAWNRNDAHYKTMLLLMCSLTEIRSVFQLNDIHQIAPNAAAAYLCVCMWMCLRVCTCVCVYVWVCVCVCVCVSLYV